MARCPPFKANVGPTRHISNFNNLEKSTCAQPRIFVRSLALWVRKDAVEVARATLKGRNFSANLSGM